MPEPKERRFIIEGFPCEVNLYPDGPRTFAEAEENPQPCPWLKRCCEGLLTQGYQCVMSFGKQIAVSALENGVSVATEIKDFLDYPPEDLAVKACNGMIWSPDRMTFEILSLEEGIGKIGKFARMILKGIEPKGRRSLRPKTDPPQPFLFDPD